MKIKNIRGDEYRGTIGKDVVHFMRNGMNIARKYVIPYDPKTASQIAQRNYLRTAVAEWHKLSNADKSEWNKRAKKDKETAPKLNSIWTIPVYPSPPHLFVISSYLPR